MYLIPTSKRKKNGYSEKMMNFYGARDSNRFAEAPKEKSDMHKSNGDKIADDDAIRKNSNVDDGIYKYNFRLWLLLYSV